MFWLIKFVIFGFFVGAIARMLHPGKDPMNWLWTILLGMAGSVVGGWIGNAIGFNTDAVLMRWVCGIAGSILLLVLYHFGTTRATPAGRVAINDDYRTAGYTDARGTRNV